MLWSFVIMLLFFNNGSLLIEVLIRGFIIVWILCKIDFANFLGKIHTFSVVDISVFLVV